ncbi:CheB methylesterase domain-containing protein, partial [Cellulomonas endophytica]|uniref:CheB methylesterase domain-containing protein n=1 Tax=Cellulomonas endophytica TaxID=2494735 RepID=UPI0013E90F28
FARPGAAERPGARPAGLPLPRAAAPAAPVRGGREVVLRAEPAPHPVRALVVGSSTGGPEALSRLFSALTAPPPVPVLVVQHMPPVFTKQLAARLDRISPATIVEASDGMELRPGTVYIAPGDRHLELRQQGVTTLTQLTDGPAVSYCRPSVDVLFRSAVRTFGGQLLAVVLTGMGADGRTGCEDVVSAGGTVVVQDEPTSVVWGMPGAVATAGLAHRVVPLDEVAPAVERVLGGAATRTRTGGASWR